MGGFTDPETGGGGFDYVQAANPDNPAEGAEWYATGGGTQAEGAYVYDGTAWIEETITEHAQLGGLSADDHPQYATDTKVDNHAGKSSVHHAKPTGTNSDGVGLSRTQIANSVTISSGGTANFTINAFVTGFKITSPNTSYSWDNNRSDIVFNYSNAESISLAESLANGFQLTPLGYVNSVDVTNSGSYSEDVNIWYWTSRPSHSHGI